MFRLIGWPDRAPMAQGGVVNLIGLRRLGGAFCCALWLASAGESAAECFRADQIAATQYEPALEEGVEGRTTRDRTGRMVAPISVNGQGPFRFIVDTGANRSALSSDLANRLGLAPVGTGEVHSVHGVAAAPLVDIDRLAYGGLSLSAGSVPLLHGAVLAGEEGLLGVDGMSGRRLTLDFEHRCIEITMSEGAPRLRSYANVRGHLRFGHLVVVQGRIRRVPVNILIDTGSDSSLANTALRDRLREVQVGRRQIDPVRAYSVGDPVVLNSAVLIPRMSIGDIEANRILAYVGDFHIFRLWNLESEPTLLVGMDVLSQTRAVVIDYRTGVVYFRLYAPPRTGSRLSGDGTNSRMSITH